MSQKDSSVSQLKSTKRDLDVELGLELDSCTDSDDEDPKSWHKSPLHVRRIKRKDGRPVSADVNYDLTSRKLLIYTFSANDGSGTKTGRRAAEPDLYLRRQSTPETFRRMSEVAGARTTDFSSKPVVRELAEREVVWEKRKSYEGSGATEDEAGGAVYPILTWSDLRRDEGNTVTGKTRSSSQRQVGNLRETVRTRLDDIERIGKHPSKQNYSPTQGDQFYDVGGTEGFQTLLNRAEIDVDRWNSNIQTPPRTGSSLPSVVQMNDVQFRSQEDMRRIWPAQIDWRIPGGDRESSSRGMLAHKIPDIGMNSAEHSEAGQRKQSSSFPQDANIHRPFWKQNAKSPTATERVSHSEKLEASLESIRSEGCLRQWRDSLQVDAKPTIDKGVPLRIEIPQENPTRQPAKERNQRTEAAVQRSATTYINFRKPEVIREGLALQSNFIGTWISRNLNVYRNNRFAETTRTRESGNAETLPTEDFDGGGSQSNDSLLVSRRKPLEFQRSSQGRFGSLRDVDATGSLQRIAISLEDNLDAAPRDVTRDVTISGSPAPPQTKQVRLEKTEASNSQNNEPSITNERYTTNRIPSFTTVNLSGSDICSKPFSPQNHQNITSLSDTSRHLGEEDGRHAESNLRVQHTSQDGLESSNSTLPRQFQDRRFQSESNIQGYPQIDIWQGEFPRNYRPLQDRSCSVPIIIQNNPPSENFWQHDSFDIHHQPIQNEFPLSNCYKPSEKTWTSESSMIPPAADLPTAWNTLASSQTILDSSSKDLKSPDSGRSFVQSAEYIASKNPRMTGIVPKCSLRVVPAESRRSKQTQDEKKIEHKSLPLIFYNSKYKHEEMIDPLARFNGKESDTWNQLCGTSGSQWHSYSGTSKHIEAERTDEHKSGDCRQDVPLGDSILTEKKPPKPRLEMTVRSQPGDWHYNTIYEPDGQSPLNEMLPTINEDDHDAIAEAGQPENQWSSLPSLLDNEDYTDQVGTCQKSISSDKIHSRIWTPTHRHQSLQTSMTRNLVDKNLPETKTTTGESGSSVWVKLSEDTTNRYHSGKHKTSYKREIKQIPFIASQMFRNTTRQSEAPAQQTQPDSAAQATETGEKETFSQIADITSTEPKNLTEAANCSDSSYSGLAKTKKELEWKRAEIQVEKEQSQDRALEINERKHSTSDTSKDGELKPGLVHIPVQHECKVNSASRKVIKRMQTETFPTEMIGSSLPAIPSSPKVNEISGFVIKLGSAERVTSDLPNTVQQAIPFRPDTKPNPSRSNHLPQIDITTIKARVFRITQDNVTTEFSAASNQLDKGEGLHNKPFTKEDVTEEHPLDQDREAEALHRYETSETSQDVNDQTAMRFEDLGMDKTFRDVDYELSNLMKVDEPKSKTNTERSVVQPLSLANLSLLDQSRTREWRNTNLEYAKQWLESTAPCNTSPFDVENCSHCDENFLNEGMGLLGGLPQEEADADKESCSFDAKVIDSIPVQDFSADKSERPNSESIGMRELIIDCNTCDVVTGNIKPSKARSRELRTESALGIPVPARPTKLQIYPEDEKSFVCPIRATLSRKKTQEKEFKDGQQNLPEKPHKQNHDSVSKGRESSTRHMAADGNNHLRYNRSPGSSAMTKGEVENRKSSPSEPVTEHMSGLATHLPQMQDNASAKLIGDHLVEELSERMTSDHSRKTDISPASPSATDEAETKDKTRSEKSGDPDARNNKQQSKISAGLVQPDKSLPRRKTSADSTSEPADTKLFHEMTLEWSPVDGNLMATKAPEQCYVCSRTARLPDIPSLKYYKLSHRCSRTSLQHVDSSTASHSVFLINSRSEMSLQELGDLSQFVSGRYGSSVPVQRHSRRSLSAVDATAVEKKHPISGDLTNVSDPCLSTAAISAELKAASHDPPIRGAPGIRKQPLRTDDQDLFTHQSKALGEFKPTNETRANMSHAKPKRGDSSAPKLQSSGQTATLNATCQGSMDDTLVKPGQTLLKPSHGGRLIFSSDGRDQTDTTCNVDGTASQLQENFQDLSDTELTDNTDVSLDGLLRAGHSPLDPYEYSDTEILFPTTDISTSVSAKFERGHECNKIAPIHDNFTSDGPKEIKIRGLHGVHHGVDEIQEASKYGVNVNSDKKPGNFKLSVANFATKQLEISPQSFELISIQKPERAYSGTPQRQPVIHRTGFTNENKLELIDPLLHSETVDERTTPGLRGNESTDDIRAVNNLQHDPNVMEPNKRTLKDMVASFDDLTSPFMKPTKGRMSTEANPETQSAVLQVQPTVVLPSGRVKYRKISQQISDLVPNYDTSRPTFANSNLHSNQDKV